MSLTVDATAFCAGLRWARPFTSTDDQFRPALEAVLVEDHGASGVLLVATDAYVLAARWVVGGPHDPSDIIDLKPEHTYLLDDPGGSIERLLADDHSMLFDGDVVIADDENCVTVTAGADSIRRRRPPHDFPKFRNLLRRRDGLCAEPGWFNGAVIGRIFADPDGPVSLMPGPTALSPLLWTAGRTFGVVMPVRVS